MFWFPYAQLKTPTNLKKYNLFWEGIWVFFFFLKKFGMFLSCDILCFYLKSKSFLSVFTPQCPSRAGQQPVRDASRFLPVDLYPWNVASTEERRGRPRPRKLHLGPKSQSHAAEPLRENITGSTPHPSSRDLSAGPRYHWWLSRLQVHTCTLKIIVKWVHAGLQYR